MRVIELFGCIIIKLQDEWEIETIDINKMK